MPRPPKAREPLKQAALQLFVENGVHATGIREIARHAGCSEAALYRHWPNKEALVTALFQEHLATVNELMRERLRAPGENAERIRNCAHAIYELYDAQPLVFRFVLLVQHEIAQDLPQDLRTPHDELIDFIREARGLKAQEERAAMLGACCIGIFLQIASYVIYGRLEGPLVRYADEVAERAIALVC